MGNTLQGIETFPFVSIKEQIVDELFPASRIFSQSYDSDNSISSSEIDSDILPQRTKACLDVMQLLASLQNHTKTELGKECIERSQSLNISVIQEEYAKIDQIRHHVDYLPLTSSFSVWKFLNSILRNTGPPPTPAFANFSYDIALVLEIQDYLSDHRQSLSLFSDVAQELSLPSELIEAFNQSFVGEDELNMIKYPTLRRIGNQISALKAQIRAKMDRMVSDPNLKDKLLSDTPMEIDGRFVLLVKQSARKGIGVILSRSQSGKTLYIEPYEIVDQTNQLMELYEDYREEEAEILRNMTRIVRLYQEELMIAFKGITKLDILRAKAAVGEQLEGIIPEVSNEGSIYCADAKHPLLLLKQKHSLQAKRKIMGNTIELNDQTKALVISGPNAGGKTIILKTCGLYAYMVRYSLPLPVQTGARFDVFEDIMADIGDLQSVITDLSTFSGHLVVCREILSRVHQSAEDNELQQFEVELEGEEEQPEKTSIGKKFSLILMDEIGTGTDPSQGAALAQSILETLTSYDHTRMIVTTHYNRIKELASTYRSNSMSTTNTATASHSPYQIAAMEFIQERPTYRLKLGSVGESHALELARRMSLPESILQRAYLLLDDETKRLVQLQTRLEQETNHMYTLQQQYQQQLLELQQRELQIQNITQRLQEQIQRIRDGKIQEFYLDLQEKQIQLVTSYQQIMNYERMLMNKYEKLQWYEQQEQQEQVNEVNPSTSNSLPEMISSQQLLMQQVQILFQQTKIETEEELLAKALQEFHANALPLGESLEVGDIVIILEPGPFYGQTGRVNQRNKGKGRILVRMDGIEAREVKLDRKFIGIPKPLSQLQQEIASLSPRERKLIELAAEIPDVPELMSTRALRRRKKALDNTNTPEKKEKKGTEVLPKDKILDLRKVTNFQEAIIAIDDFITQQLDDSSFYAQYEENPNKNKKIIFTIYLHHGIQHSLKGRIRNWLERNELIQDFHPASLSQGGDAYTVVEVSL